MSTQASARRRSRASFIIAAALAVVLIVVLRLVIGGDSGAGGAGLRSEDAAAGAAPVRVFTLSYGRDADQQVLTRIAETTNAAEYDSSDPTSINQVFTAVISNF